MLTVLQKMFMIVLFDASSYDPSSFNQKYPAIQRITSCLDFDECEPCQETIYFTSQYPIFKGNKEIIQSDII